MFGNWTFGTLVFTVLVFTVTFKVTRHIGTLRTRADEVSEVSLTQALCLVVGSRYSLLDLDQPFCHLGLTDLLCGLLSAVGRNHLVHFQKYVYVLM